jgi:hypothetical protein
LATVILLNKVRVHHIAAHLIRHDLSQGSRFR